MSTLRANQDIVPFVDLGFSHRPLRDDLLDDFAELIDTGAFTNGPAVGAFESAFADYCGTSRCVGVASGLDALRLALLARDIGSGDEVIVPAGTFVATLEAVSQSGATPVPVDIGDADYCIDPGAIGGAITERTRAIMPVHLYGQLADMAAIARVAGARGVDVVEDACQAHGATRGDVGAGSTSTAAAFSFYPGKNLGAFGDAGALVTNDDALADRVRSLREHGQSAKYRHDEVGWTARLDTVQAIVLGRKLPLLDEWNADRRRAAAAYSDALAGVGDLRLPPVAPGSEPVWHLYVVRTADPAALADHLREQGVQTGRHYPDPVHLTGAYRHLGHGRGAFPVSERLAAEALSLPIFPGISESQQARVVEAVESYFASAR